MIRKNKACRFICLRTDKSETGLGCRNNYCIGELQVLFCQSRKIWFDNSRILEYEQRYEIDRLLFSHAERERSEGKPIQRFHSVWSTNHGCSGTIASLLWVFEWPSGRAGWSRQSFLVCLFLWSDLWTLLFQMRITRICDIWCSLKNLAIRWSCILWERLDIDW
jgi:hypothetical protein